MASGPDQFVNLIVSQSLAGNLTVLAVVKAMGLSKPPLRFGVAAPELPITDAIKELCVEVQPKAVAFANQTFAQFTPIAYHFDTNKNGTIYRIQVSGGGGGEKALL